MSLGTTIESIQDIMRKDVGVDGDAQRIVMEMRELIALCDELESRLSNARESSVRLAAAVVHNLAPA